MFMNNITSFNLINHFQNTHRASFDKLQNNEMIAATQGNALISIMLSSLMPSPFSFTSLS